MGRSGPLIGRGPRGLGLLRLHYDTDLVLMTIRICASFVSSTSAICNLQFFICSRFYRWSHFNSIVNTLLAATCALQGLTLSSHCPRLSTEWNINHHSLQWNVILRNKLFISSSWADGRESNNWKTSAKLLSFSTTQYFSQPHFSAFIFAKRWIPTAQLFMWWLCS